MPTAWFSRPPPLLRRSMISPSSFEIIQLLERFGQIAVGGFVEGRDAHVADAGLHHLREFNARAGNFVAHDGHFDGLVPAFASQRNVNGGSLGALQHVGHLRGGEAGAVLAVNLQDRVAGANTRFCSRRSHEGRKHHGLVLARRDGHADAVIFSFLLFAEQRVLLRIEKVRVRIEHVQHARNRAVVDGLVYIDRIGVIALDDRKHAREAFDGILQVIRSAGGRRPHRRSVQAAQQRRNSQQQGPEEIDHAPRISVLGNDSMRPRFVRALSGSEKYSIEPFDTLSALFYDAKTARTSVAVAHKCSAFPT